MKKCDCSIINTGININNMKRMTLAEAQKLSDLSNPAPVEVGVQQDEDTVSLSSFLAGLPNPGLSTTWEDTFAAFQTLDDSLRDFTPNNNYSVEIEIMRGVFNPGGYTVVNSDGGFFFSFETDSNPFNRGTDSQLNFEQRVNNLRAIYLSRGEDAKNYTAEFEDALNTIIMRYFGDPAEGFGNHFLNENRAGVVDSIHAMFRGEEGRYTADYIKAMLTLPHFTGAERRLGISEFEFGASLGLKGLALKIMNDSGMFSSNAFETVWSAFERYVDETIDSVTYDNERAPNDLYFGRRAREAGLFWSPINAAAIRESVDIMLQALESPDFDQGMRRSIATLSGRYAEHRNNQIATGTLDWRNQNASFGSMGLFEREGHERASADIATMFDRLANFLGRPELTLSGNLFSGQGVNALV
jgi:hypothetical protein